MCVSVLLSFLFKMLDHFGEKKNRIEERRLKKKGTRGTTGRWKGGLAEGSGNWRRGFGGGAASLCVCEREKGSGAPPAAVCRLGVHGG